MDWSVPARLRSSSCTWHRSDDDPCPRNTTDQLGSRMDITLVCDCTMLDLGGNLVCRKERLCGRITRCISLIKL